MIARSAVLPYWPDRPAAEALEIAGAAERAGLGELWIGEMATYDAFALATAIAVRHSGLRLTVGPLSVHVRSPAGLAMGVASVAELTGRDVGLALGTSSPVVVGWHERRWDSPAATLDRCADEVGRLLAGGRSSSGFRLRVPVENVALTVAAFGPRAIETAARRADRLVLNLVTVAAAARARDALDAAASRAGRAVLRLAVWVTAAVDPSADAWDQVTRGLVAYLAAPGYREILSEAGARDAVELARGGAHPRELFAALSPDVAAAIGLFGDAGTLARRAAAYRAAGVDELCVAPATVDDPGGGRTFAALAGAT